MRPSDKPQRGPKGTAGLESIFTGLGDLVRTLGDLADKQAQGEHEIPLKDKDGQEKGKVVFGFNISTASDGESGGGLKVEPFGNFKSAEPDRHAHVAEVREPIVDVFEEEDHILIVAEMPGVDEAQVQVEIEGDILTLHTEDGSAIRYRKELLLPHAVNPESLERSMEHGVLKIKALPAA